MIDLSVRNAAAILFCLKWTLTDILDPDSLQEMDLGLRKAGSLLSSRRLQVAFRVGKKQPKICVCSLHQALRFYLDTPVELRFIPEDIYRKQLLLGV